MRDKLSDEFECHKEKNSEEVIITFGIRQFLKLNAISGKFKRGWRCKTKKENEKDKKGETKNEKKRIENFSNHVPAFELKIIMEDARFTGNFHLHPPRYNPRSAAE